MSLSPDQIARRLEGMSATDIAAVVGCHPHRGPINVYLEKTGQAAPFVGNVRTWWGEKLEPLIRTNYEERHNVTVEVHGTHTHLKYPWWLATPDGLVYERGSRMPVRGLEIKVHGRDEVRAGNIEYGAPGTDEVPLHELIQCAWGMGATGLHRWDLVPFIDGIPEEFTIERDDDLIGMLGEQAEKFLVDHVRPRVPPPPDGSSAWDDWLKRRWGKNTDELVAIDGDPAVMQMVYRLRDVRLTQSELEIQKDKLVQELKLVIGERAGFTWREMGRRKPSKLTWKRSKDGERADGKATIAAMRTAAALFSSANAVDIERALKTPGNAEAQFVDLLSRACDTLREIAAMPIKTTPMPGARPFNTPRHWPKMKPTEDEKTDETETTTDTAEEN